MRAKVATDWIPEDIYVSLRAGASQAYAIGKDEGFVILQRQERWRGACLFVWVIEGKLAEHEADIYDELEEIARGINARTIEMHSARPGWATRGFWEPTETVYVHEVK